MKKGYFFANNFFMVHFFKTFSTDSKSAFFDTHIEFFIKKFIFALISIFCKLWLQMCRKRLKKTENLFLWMCLRILLGNHQRVCISKLLKSLYPNVHSILQGHVEYRYLICDQILAIHPPPSTLPQAVETFLFHVMGLVRL